MTHKGGTGCQYSVRRKSCVRKLLCYIVSSALSFKGFLTARFLHFIHTDTKIHKCHFRLILKITAISGKLK